MSLEAARAVVGRYARAAYHGADLRAALLAAGAPEAAMRLCHPFETLAGTAAFWEAALGPLAAAWPDLERRDHIRIAGADEDGAAWVGCCGYYVGTFTAPWLDIPPTGHVAHMRYHEFFRVEGDCIVEMQAVWDIPEVMLQAGAWPMVPALGREWHVPGPATGDGLGPHGGDGAAARQHVIDMLTAMIRHPAEGGPELMELERFWHPKFMWYGPTGIGTARGIDGFRRHHQIPFLKAMPDRGQHPEKTNYHFFAEGDYVGVTGWPNMAQTLTGDGWLGLAPAGQAVTLRSLDFWRLEDGLIRENWVLIDLLHVYHQLGIDVFERMRELTGQRREPWSPASV